MYFCVSTPIDTPMSFIANHVIFCHELPKGHRFPMLKYELLPLQLLHEGIVEEKDFFEPECVQEAFINYAHKKSYWERLLRLDLNRKEIQRIGFPLSEKLIERELRIIQGTIDGAEIALKKKGIAFNVAGGTHHAGSDWGEGFCLLNDHAIAAHHLLNKHSLKKILILDLDVHQGNGTAEIFSNENRVFTFSMHGESNFPFQKEVSDWDIGLSDGTNGEVYLNRLNEALNKVIKKINPEFIFYQSGVDVLQQDTMGRLKLTSDDCRQRDRLVFEACKKHEIPVQVSMGGGYSKRIADIVDAHTSTFKEGIQTLL